MNLTTDWASRWALYRPTAMALKEWETQRTLTYAQLNHQANHLAVQLQRVYQLQLGDRVAVLAENCLEYLVLFSAVQKMGLILVPLNYRLAASEIDFLLQDSGPRLLIVQESFQSLLGPAAASIPQWPLAEVAQFCQAADTAAPKSFPAVELPAQHPIFILYTSGTTGFPKGAIYTHQMLFWNSINTAMSLVINNESRTVVCMPPFHTGGWNVLTTPLLHHGGYVCLLKKFEVDAVFSALEQEQPTLFMAVPTMLKMLADCPRFESANLSSLLYFIVGGEPMPIALIETWHRKGIAIRQGFGMTEVGPNLFSLHHTDALRKKGSIGRPNFYVNIKIVNAQGQTVGPNEPGELLLQGPMTTPGYWQNPEATAQALRDGWFHTGDMVRQDEEAYVYVVDRIKNMFISGGENVYPAEIERVLLSHPAVAAAVVLGIPDSRWGEVGMAFVVLEAQATADAETLEAFCRERLARFKVPKYFQVLPELPVSATGKINRLALRKFLPK